MDARGATTRLMNVYAMNEAATSWMCSGRVVRPVKSANGWTARARTGIPGIGSCMVANLELEDSDIAV